MYKYQNNAFRILGLLASASTQEIISRVGEIKVKKSLGFEMVYEYDFPWMGPLDRSEENVINALQRLEDPVARLKEEIFWFWLESEEDKRALDYLKNNKRQAAHDIWRSIAYNSNVQSSNSDSSVEKPSEKSIAACLNDAILAHSSVIARERNIRYQQEELKESKIIVQNESEVLCCPDCHKIYDKEWKICIKCGVNLVIQKNEQKEEVVKSRESSAVLDESHWKTWRFALNKLSSLDKLDGYWEKVNDKARRLNDARLTDNKIDEMKVSFLSETLDVNFTFMSQALVSKDYERVKRHSGLINGLSLATHLLKNGLNRALVYQIELLNQCSKSNKEEVSKLPKDVTIQDAMNIYSKFCNRIKEPIYEGNLVDINCLSDFALARDSVATEMRDMAIMVNNKFHNYKEALAIIKEAVEYAASQYIKERFKKDEAVISNNLGFQPNVSSNVGSNVGRKDQSVSDKKTSIKNLFQDPFSISNWKNFISYWKPVLIWAGIILFLVVYSSNSNKSSSTAHYSSSSSSSEISSLNAEISSGRAKIAELEMYLNSGGKKLAAIKDETDQLNAKYQYASYVPDNIEPYYNSKVQEYNSLRETYNRVYNEYETLRAEINAKINRYNELVKR
ncbi:MAG: hypothetical protein WC357_01155 [Candidatus Omnitrophota bacterium]|jgi:hypothetical protein